MVNISHNQNDFIELDFLKSYLGIYGALTATRENYLRGILKQVSEFAEFYLGIDELYKTLQHKWVQQHDETDDTAMNAINAQLRYHQNYRHKYVQSSNIKSSYDRQKKEYAIIEFDDDQNQCNDRDTEITFSVVLMHETCYLIETVILEHIKAIYQGFELSMIDSIVGSYNKLFNLKFR